MAVVRPLGPLLGSLPAPLPLNCLQTNAHSTGNKWEGLESCVWSQGRGPIAVTEMWWDSLHDWNAGVDDCVPRKTGQPGEVVELLFT